MEFWRFSSPDPSLGPPLDASYDPLVVILSVTVACYAGLTALLLVDRVIASRSASARTWWLCSGAVAMGCGIWAMHFTGMLAFSLPVRMGYDVVVTVISLVPAILGSGAALYFMTLPRLTGWKLQLGALLMALGIGTMHYTGMEAMNIEGLLRYDIVYFCLSILVAHVLALVALYIRFGLRQFASLHDLASKIIGGIIMGIAVAGMHYTAMAASRFYEMPGAQLSGLLFSHTAMALTISSFGGVILSLSVAAAWIHRQKGIQRMLEQIANTDVLTGLSNRVHFSKQLENVLNRCRRNGNRLAVMFLDLDDFKTINDSLGHAVGDLVLEEVAERLRSSLRDGDLVARFGGDEFIFLVQDIGASEDAAPVAERILEALQSPTQLGGWQLHHAGSIGISIFPDDGSAADELIQHADAAMYQAKKGHQGYCFFDQRLTELALERVRLGVALRKAIKEGQFVLHYQPWVDLRTGNWLGLEALARWPHPDEGWIAPNRFIPLLEKSGLILRFGDWALREACSQGRKWLDAGFDFGRLAVNIAAPQLEHDEFVPRLSEILRHEGLPGDRLELEITESSLMGGDSGTIERLETIRGLGVGLAIDDFGTGYSSLSYLKDLPIDKLKVDQSFVSGIARDVRDYAIVRAICDLGTSLGFKVVAEGVETSEQVEELAKLDCRAGQGYLFARPESAVMVEKHPAVTAS
jgi:diguanylate cyclase (GGDEF)-like protein